MVQPASLHGRTSSGSVPRERSRPLGRQFRQLLQSQLSQRLDHLGSQGDLSHRSGNSGGQGHLQPQRQKTFGCWLQTLDIELGGGWRQRRRSLGHQFPTAIGELPGAPLAILEAQRTLMVEGRLAS